MDGGPLAAGMMPAAPVENPKALFEAVTAESMGDGKEEKKEKNKKRKQDKTEKAEPKTFSEWGSPDVYHTGLYLHRPTAGIQSEKSTAINHYVFEIHPSLHVSIQAFPSCQPLAASGWSTRRWIAASRKEGKLASSLSALKVLSTVGTSQTS